MRLGEGDRVRCVREEKDIFADVAAKPSTSWFGRLLVWPPHWLIVVAGLVTGISILSYGLRQMLIAGDETKIWMFGLFHFAGYLFFIVSPVEILFARMVELDHGLGLLWMVAVGTAMVGKAIDYLIGYALNYTVIENIIGEKKDRRYYKRIEKYGGMTIFFFCLFPLSSPIVLLVAGMMRYPTRWAILLSVVGLSIKYAVIGYLVL